MRRQGPYTLEWDGGEDVSGEWKKKGKENPKQLLNTKTNL